MPDDTIGFTIKELFVEIRNDLHRVSDQVQEILQKGSQHAQFAVRKVDALEVRVESLEKSTASQEAVGNAMKSLRTIWWGLAGTIILNALTLIISKMWK